MRRIRVGMLIVGALAVLVGHGNTALALTAADEAFLKKKIVARWNITGKNQIEAAYARGVDILEDHPNPANGFFTVLVSSEELDALRADGYDIKITDSDVHASFAAKSGMTMNGFLTWDEALAKLDSFHLAFPALTSEMISLGTTLEGRDLWAMKISDNPGVDEAEPEILFTGIHHAREPISMEIVLHTMRTLLFGYGVDQTITDLVNGREVYFVPFVNPDGYVWNEVLIGMGQYPGWRKNRRPNAGGSFGVDPNRNYGNHWGFDNVGSSPNGLSETYRGTAAFSELENQHIRDFVDTSEIVIAVNFHSYSNLFLWAPGNAAFYTPDESLFEAIGDSVASFHNYADQAGWKLYTTNGDADDWFYFDKGVLAFTPEVGSQSDGFWPDPSRIPALVNENIPGNLFLIELAGSPERMLPPLAATWISPDTVNVSDFTLQWSDAGGVNAAVSHALTELTGRSVITDFSDNGIEWNMDGFSISSTQAFSGTQSFWGGSSNNRTARIVSKDYYTPQAGDTLRVRVWYSTETNWDYAYVEVSSDHGQSWATLSGNITTNSNPNGKNRGNGIQGSSGGAFADGKFSLSSYVGADILIRFSYETDGASLGAGVFFDNVYPVVAFSSEVELDPSIAATDFPITGKAPGTYYYSLTSTDADGQENTATPPHVVTVDYVVCDCNCHADPSCDGATNILDVVQTVGIAFRGEVPTIDASCPHEPAGRSDVDCSGATSVVDVVRMVGVAFRGENPATNFCDPCTP